MTRRTIKIHPTEQRMRLNELRSQIRQWDLGVIIEAYKAGYTDLSVYPAFIQRIVVSIMLSIDK